MTDKLNLHLDYINSVVERLPDIDTRKYGLPWQNDHANITDAFSDGVILCKLIQQNCNRGKVF